MDNDLEQRRYWTTKMEEAWVFMERMRTWPIQECGEPMVSLVDASDGLEVAFSSSLLGGCYPRVFFCREGLIAQFRSVAQAMNARGWVLKVEDAYRSPAMQRAQTTNPKHFDLVLQKTIWELGGAVPDPRLLMRRMAALIAARCRIGTHVSGSAIDISVLDRTTGQEVPRGGSYIEISHRTPMDSPFLDTRESENRRAITALLQAHGWVAYPWEFWHYSSGDSYAEYLTDTGQPGRYGPIHFDGHTSIPIPDPESDALLNSEDFYREQIQAALLRLGKNL